MSGLAIWIGVYLRELNIRVLGRYCNVVCWVRWRLPNQGRHEGDLLLTGYDVASLDADAGNNGVQWRKSFRRHFHSDHILREEPSPDWWLKASFSSIRVLGKGGAPWHIAKESNEWSMLIWYLLHLVPTSHDWHQLENNRARERVAVDSRKWNLADFALWKDVKLSEPS